MSAADECNWREYPPAGPIRVEPFDSSDYGHADVMEALLNDWFNKVNT